VLPPDLAYRDLITCVGLQWNCGHIAPARTCLITSITCPVLFSQALSIKIRYTDRLLGRSNRSNHRSSRCARRAENVTFAILSDHSNMNLTSKQKKVIGILIIILLGIVELVLLANLAFTVLDGDAEATRADVVVSISIMAVMVFPLAWALRLRRSGAAESLRQKAGERFVPAEGGGNAIRIEVKIELPVYRKLIFRQTYTKPLYIFFYVFGAGLIVLNAPNILDDWFTLFTTIFLLYLPIGVYRAANANYKATQALHETIAYEFTPEAITATGESFTTTMQWTMLHKMHETKRWLLLYTNKQAAVVIPKSAFASASEIDLFRQMSRHVPV
jgi:hypothetical protein